MGVKMLIATFLICGLGGIAPDFDHLVYDTRAFLHSAGGIWLAYFLLLLGLAITLIGRLRKTGILK